MQALGNIVMIEPQREAHHSIEFQIKRKIQKGILVSKGNGTPAELKEGQLVYFMAGNHREFENYIFMSYLTLQGYEGN